MTLLLGGITSHLHEFVLDDGIRLSSPIPMGQPGSCSTTGDYVVPARASEQFVYAFDLGDDWGHICTSETVGFDPVDEARLGARGAVAVLGWGRIPDQYRRRWESDGRRIAGAPRPESDRPPHPCMGWDIW